MGKVGIVTRVYKDDIFVHLRSSSAYVHVTLKPFLYLWANENQNMTSVRDRIAALESALHHSEETEIAGRIPE